jgi:hypothetical protein
MCAEAALKALSIFFLSTFFTINIFTFYQTYTYQNFNHFELNFILFLFANEKYPSNSIMQNVDMEILEGHSQSLLQEIQSLPEKIDDMTPASYDGTLVWRVTNVQKKLSKI